MNGGGYVDRLRRANLSVNWLKSMDIPEGQLKPPLPVRINVLRASLYLVLDIQRLRQVVETVK